MSTYASRVHLHRPHVNVWLVAVVGLAAALVALGSWVLIDRYSGTEYEAATVADDLMAAVNARDADAVASMITADAVFVDAGGDVAVAADVISTVPQTPWTMERVSPVTVEGDFAATFVRMTPREGLTEGVPVDVAVNTSTEQLVVFQLENGKIARMWDFLPGFTEPFDSANMPWLGTPLSP